MRRGSGDLAHPITSTASTTATRRTIVTLFPRNRPDYAQMVIEIGRADLTGSAYPGFGQVSPGEA